LQLLNSNPTCRNLLKGLPDGWELPSSIQPSPSTRR
jgi:hypothetical protein